ncbi:hypothetical protein J25TS5_15220 [Paenibacillus faecis]|uniref:hypothetical protein n=1 Tax=Paenibacillus faecis TaxID=862114 RepID=UPI001B10810F|nr:hypothetical protein [Paenibacillus faecis]GIO84590.1 hypothetical protein J25TS5_15220 [Paenibacillus faecis]
MDEQRVREIVREELEKAAAESFKCFGQKLQQPEGQALLKKVFGKNDSLQNLQGVENELNEVRARKVDSLKS